VHPWRKSMGTLSYSPSMRSLIVEERLREQPAEGVRMPERIELDELALRILIAAETGSVPAMEP
jgi:hypothetical protein